jgi:hypothetical protein
MIFYTKNRLYKNCLFQTLPQLSELSGYAGFHGIHDHHVLDGVDRHYPTAIQNDNFGSAYTQSQTLRGSAIDYELSGGGRYLHGKTFF